MENNIPSSYYAIIPAYIRYNKELKFAERLMYGEITALSNKEGYCFASNRYFADLYGVSQSTISRWISHLAELGSLHVEIIRNDKKEIVERRIYVVDNPYMQNNQYPYVQNSTYPICRKSKDNIINNNMLDSFFNYIINKEKKIPKEFENLELQILEVLEKYKTNKSEDYIEYGTYNTQKNNYIDFTSVELSDDEYITDFKVEFGTVMPGFEAVEKPFIFAKVLPTVKPDDRWVNYTNLTGNYKEHELEDKAEWPTISYGKKLEIKKLPRTGF